MAALLKWLRVSVGLTLNVQTRLSCITGPVVCCFPSAVQGWNQVPFMDTFCLSLPVGRVCLYGGVGRRDVSTGEHESATLKLLIPKELETAWAAARPPGPAAGGAEAPQPLRQHLQTGRAERPLAAAMNKRYEAQLQRAAPSRSGCLIPALTPGAPQNICREQPAQLQSTAELLISVGVVGEGGRGGGGGAGVSALSSTRAANCDC